MAPSPAAGGGHGPPASVRCGRNALLPSRAGCRGRRGFWQQRVCCMDLGGLFDLSSAGRLAARFAGSTHGHRGPPGATPGDRPRGHCHKTRQSETAPATSAMGCDGILKISRQDRVKGARLARASPTPRLGEEEGFVEKWSDASQRRGGMFRTLYGTTGTRRWGVQFTTHLPAAYEASPSPPEAPLSVEN